MKSTNKPTQPPWVLIAVAIIGVLGSAAVCGVPIVARLIDIYLPIPTPIFTSQPPSTIENSSQNTVGSDNLGLCPDSVPRSVVQEWSIGEVTEVSVVEDYINVKFESYRRYEVPPYGNFTPDDTIPSGVVIAINFKKPLPWDGVPVKPIIYIGGHGLFETIGEFKPPNEGACITITP